MPASPTPPPRATLTRRTRAALTAGAVIVALTALTPLFGSRSPEPPPSDGRGSAPAAAPAAAEAAAETLCAPAGVLRGGSGAKAAVSLCTSTGGPSLALSAPASCSAPGGRTYACRTSGTWTARKDGEVVARGALPGSADRPGPGTYEITAEVRVRSTPAGIDLRGGARAPLTLTEPLRAPTHRIEVDRERLRPGRTTVLTYTVHRDSEEGDGSGRFGLIGEEDSGIRLTTDDARCVNPLIGRHPSKERLVHSLDCALTDLQPGNPSTVVVRATTTDTCSTVVSKLGYWMPKGQTFRTGGMVAGPAVACTG
ncbi:MULTISPECIES: hypothetical protein [Streptomyces]|uniref:hypothetical protein n=1 Tax=Streptomyces TaxID=1883 RepID=UPI001F0E8C59|nr:MULTISPECIES: hypothetical protein [Streptomyces]MDH6228706.1 hypothetical protein [Streptomyces sp. MJP52]